MCVDERPRRLLDGAGTAQKFLTWKKIWNLPARYNTKEYQGHIKEKTETEGKNVHAK